MYTLTPIIHPIIKDFLQDKEKLFSFVQAYGSPLNIIFPQNMQDAINDFKTVYKSYGMQGTVYYAHKPNKSQALVKQAQYEGVYIDIASENELKSALTNGFTGSQIEATGPKNDTFLLLALEHAVLLSVDSIDELETIARLHVLLRKKEKTKILIRLSGFSSGVTKVSTKESRFGIHVSEFPDVMKIIKKHELLLDFQGLSFHLDTSGIQEKATALDTCIQILTKVQDQGMYANTINIGGGFRVNFLKKEEEWQQYLHTLKESVMAGKYSVAWNNSGLGFRNEQGILRGESRFYEYFVNVSQGEYLKALLSTPFSQDPSQSLGQIVSDLMLHLSLEPGRALVNQVGITLAQINFVKKSQSGDLLIGLDMNKTNLGSVEQEMMLDPFVIHKTKSKTLKKIGAYFVGNLCLESDFIYKHKTFLSTIPQKGDIVVFINTGGYNMDFYEANTLQQNIAKKIAVIKKKDSFDYFEDHQYNPYLHI